MRASPRCERVNASAPHWAEDAALDHLLRSGWDLLGRNFRVRGGEIDLIMRDENVVVFVEVRQRSTDRFGGAAASIDARKLARVRLAARHFLAREGLGEDVAVRFDAVLLTGPEGAARIEHLHDVV